MINKTVRCKFVCADVLKHVDGFKTRFMPVCGGSPENEKFFKFTPSGLLEVGTHKDDEFVPGKEYYIDISEAI